MTVPERLALFRSEWPACVTWSEVRDEDPLAFRGARNGALLLIPVVSLLLVQALFAFDFPVVVPLPGWLDLLRPLILLASTFLTILLIIFGWAMLSIPGDARRGIAFRRFAEERSLSFASYGALPSRLGFFFAEKLSSRVAHRRPHRAPVTPSEETAPLFQSRHALFTPGDWVNPDMTIAIARYSGGKNDPKGPWTSFRYLSLRMPRALPHLLVDSRSNGSLHAMLPGSQRLSFEGDFDRHFTVYAPEGYERDALELLTPDVMACLIDYGRSWDIEVIEDRLVVASRRVRAHADRDETTALLYFAELIGTEVGHQAKTYSDPRAEKPSSQVASAGRRLRRRSALWATVGFLVFTLVIFGYPYVLEWWLDR